MKNCKNGPKTEKNRKNLETLELIMVSMETFSSSVRENHLKQLKCAKN